MSDTPADDNDEQEHEPAPKQRKQLPRSWRYLITDRTTEDGPRGKEDAIPHFLSRHADHENEPEYVEDPLITEGEAAMKRTT